MQIESVDSDRMFAPPVARMFRAAFAVIAACSLPLSIYLTIRAASSQVAPLSRFQLVIAFCTLLLVLCVTRVIGCRFTQSNLMLLLATSSIVLLSAIPISMLAPTRFDAGIFWLLLVVGDGCGWQMLAPRMDQPQLSVFTQPDGGEEETIDEPELVSEEFSDDEEEFDPSVTQSLVRRKLDSGEVIEGLLLAELEPNARRATLHVAFCPPFEGDPKIEQLHQLDGPEARIEVAEVRSYGARFDVQVSQAYDEGVEVRVHFEAVSMTHV